MKENKLGLETDHGVTRVSPVFFGLCLFGPLLSNFYFRLVHLVIPVLTFRTSEWKATTFVFLPD